MTIKQAITKGMIMLKSNNVESPKLKARLLLPVSYTHLTLPTT